MTLSPNVIDVEQAVPLSAVDVNNKNSLTSKLLPKDGDDLNGTDISTDVQAAEPFRFRRRNGDPGSGIVAVIEAVTEAILAIMQAIVDIINGSSLSDCDGSRNDDIVKDGVIVSIIDAIAAATVAIIEAIGDIINGRIRNCAALATTGAVVYQGGEGIVAVIEAITAAILAIMQAIIDIINGKGFFKAAISVMISENGDKSELLEYRLLFAVVGICSIATVCLIAGIIFTALSGIYMSRRWSAFTADPSLKKTSYQNNPDDFGLPSYIPFLISALATICNAESSHFSAGTIMTLGIGLSLANRGLAFPQEICDTTASCQRLSGKVSILRLFTFFWSAVGLFAFRSSSMRTNILRAVLAYGTMNIVFYREKSGEGISGSVSSSWFGTLLVLFCAFIEGSHEAYFSGSMELHVLSFMLFLIFGAHCVSYLTMTGTDVREYPRGLVIDAMKALVYTLFVSAVRIIKSLIEIKRNGPGPGFDAEVFFVFAMLGLLYGVAYSTGRTSRSVSCVQIGWALLGLCAYTLIDAIGFSTHVLSAAVFPLILFSGRILASPCISIRNYNLAAIMVNHCVLLTSTIIYMHSASQDSMLEQVLTSLGLFLILISALFVCCARLTNNPANGCSLASKAVFGFLIAFMIQRATTCVANSLILFMEDLDYDLYSWMVENKSTVAIGILGSYLFCSICWSVGSALTIGSALLIADSSFSGNNLLNVLSDIFGFPMKVLLGYFVSYSNGIKWYKSSSSSLVLGVVKTFLGASIIAASGIVAALLLKVEIEYLSHYVAEHSQTALIVMIGVFLLSTVMGISLFFLIAGCSFILAHIFGYQQAIMFVSIAAGVGSMAGAIVSYSVGKSFARLSHPIGVANSACSIMSAIRLMPLRHFSLLNYSAGITKVSFSQFVSTLLLSFPRVVCAAAVGSYIGCWSRTEPVSALSFQLAVVANLSLSVIGLILLAKDIKARETNDIV